MSETRPASDLLNVQYLSVETSNDVIVLPYTTWGDYIGGTVERSNHDAIAEDFPDAVDSEYLGYGAYRLVVRAESEIPSVLFDAVVGLGDYPLYSEEHHSLLEVDLEADDWALYGRDELRDQIVKRVAEGYDGDADIEDHVEAHFTDEVLNSAYWDACSKGNPIWESESATGGYFRDLDVLAETLAEGWLRDFERVQRGDLPEWRCEGQIALDIPA